MNKLWVLIIFFAVFFHEKIFLFRVNKYFLCLLVFRRWFLNWILKIFSFYFCRNRISSFDDFVVLLVVKFYIVPDFRICSRPVSVLNKFFWSFRWHIIWKCCIWHCVWNMWLLLDVLNFLFIVKLILLSFSQKRSLLV